MSETTMMQAIAFNTTGPADVLAMLALPKPSPAPDQVLLRVVAAGVNPADALFRSGGLPFVRLKFPFIPGLDVAGIVETVGAAVTQFRPGDAVYGMLPNAKMGGYAEYAVIAEDALTHIPPTLGFSAAAAVPCAALTALQALRDRAQLKPGMSVLINGASGGVGSFAVQIARAMGAQVTATTSARNLDMVRELGADEVLDYARTPLAGSGKMFDVVFDAVGLLPYSAVQSVLRHGGTGVTVNPLRGNPFAQLRARLGGRGWTALFVKPRGGDLRLLNTWLRAGSVRPVIERCYPLADAAEAQRHSESKRVRGKLVLIVDEQRAAQPAAQ